MCNRRFEVNSWLSNIVFVVVAFTVDKPLILGWHLTKERLKLKKWSYISTLPFSPKIDWAMAGKAEVKAEQAEDFMNHLIFEGE